MSLVKTGVTFALGAMFGAVISKVRRGFRHRPEDFARKRWSFRCRSLEKKTTHSSPIRTSETNVVTTTNNVNSTM